MAQTAINKQTGERLQWDGTAWKPLTEVPAIPPVPAVPVGRTAINRLTGERLAYDGKAWVPIQNTGPEHAISGAARGAAAAANPQYAQERLGELGSMAPSAPKLPTAEQTQAGFEKEGVIIPPTNPTQELIQAGAAGATAGLPVGGIPGAIGGAASAAAAEKARQEGAPVWQQVLIGAGVPILGGMTLQGVVSMFRSAPKTILRGVLEDATPQQMFEAQMLMDDAAKEGIKLTVAESLGLVTGQANQPLLQLQRYLEGVPGGRGKFATVMAERPGQNALALDKYLEQVRPGAVTGQERVQAPFRLQQAAEGSMDQMVADLRKRTGPYHQQASGDLLPDGALRDILSDLDDVISKTGADKAKLQLMEFRRDLVDRAAQPASTPSMAPITGQAPRAAVAEQPVLDIGRLDSITKYWRDRIGLPEISELAITKEVSSKIGRTVKKLRDQMKATSPAFRVASEIHETGLTDDIQPTQRSPLGQLAAKEQSGSSDDLMRQQQRILSPMDPATTDAQTIRSTGTALKAQDKTAFEVWQRVNLESHFEKAIRDMANAQAGEWGGARFVMAIAGNKRQEENLQALIESLDNGQQIWKGFQHYLAMLRAQGMRQRPGSQTEMNRLITQEVEQGRIPVGLLAPIKQTQTWWSRLRAKSNAKVLTDLMLDPDGAAIMTKMANLSPRSTLSRLYFGAVSGVLAKYIDASERQPANQPENPNAPVRQNWLQELWEKRMQRGEGLNPGMSGGDLGIRG